MSRRVLKKDCQAEDTTGNLVLTIKEILRCIGDLNNLKVFFFLPAASSCRLYLSLPKILIGHFTLC